MLCARTLQLAWEMEEDDFERSGLELTPEEKEALDREMMLEERAERQRRRDDMSEKKKKEEEGILAVSRKRAKE
eukprot:CAMPEP_0196594004 /NCGR_PEP_ID=MMETSP1081-20130531/77126_1 /TAXON_ID=36882 /ORGANISM="Pyramimonas amylifera, Strain CCMP720" /LENGTH=73 /DNA_ID=CAMNT_0041918147 /DNA_START=98 /DNA_END=316 /DNA_ORIENTATION=-